MRCLSFSYDIVNEPIGRATNLVQPTDHAVILGANVELLGCIVNCELVSISCNIDKSGEILTLKAKPR